MVSAVILQEPIVNNRIATIGTVIAALILVLLGGIFAVLLSRPVSAAQVGGVGPRQITVVGNGEVKVTPDMATVQIGAQTDGATSQEALNANNTQVAAIIAKLKELGIAEADIQTANFSISPRYDTNGQTVTGYQVSNTVSVTIRNLSQAGTLLDEVVKVGANQVYGISFDVADRTALENQARDKALENAKAKAQQLATAAGGSIGQVLVVTETIGGGPVFPMAARADVAAGVPVQAGQQTVSLQVQVTYQLQ